MAKFNKEKSIVAKPKSRKATGILISAKNAHLVKKGMWFTADIEHQKNVTGKIQIDGKGIDKSYFLCQHSFNGADCKDKLGYPYSWVVYNLGDLQRNSVRDLVVYKSKPDMPEFKIHHEILGGYNVYVTMRKSIKFGCTEINLSTVKGLIEKLGYKMIALKK